MIDCMNYFVVTEIIPMFENVEMLSEDTFSIRDDDFSFATKGLGDRMKREINSAKQSKVKKRSI